MIIDFLLDDIRKAIAGLEDEVSGLTAESFASVDYVSSAKTIYFYNAVDEEVGSIDTTDFVVDGMIDTVSISGNVLHFVFNTDAGKQPIDVDLSSVMPDLSAYWTSAQTQSAITAVEDHLFDVEQVTASALTELHDDVLELSARTVDLSPYYTSAQTEDAILAKNYVTSAQVETQIVEKNYVTSAQVEDQIIAKNYITSAQTEDAIDEAISAYTPTANFATINGSAITNGGNIVIQGGGGDMSDYWTSAQTKDAISAATAGKADAANVAPKSGRNFPNWNAQGIITGSTEQAYLYSDLVNGKIRAQLFSNGSSSGFNIYAPEAAGTAGDILVSTGNGAPVWSAVTFPDVSNYVTSAQVETQIVEKNYITSAATANMVSSTYVSTIWKGTQAEYDAIVDKDPNTFYIIL